MIDTQEMLLPMTPVEDDGEEVVRRALVLLHDETTESDRRAVALLEPLVRAQLASAQLLLGWLREAGRGCDRNLAVAEQLYRAAADQEHPTAQFYLGKMYQRRGDGDLAWFEFARAASQSFAPAYYRLAIHELERHGTNEAAMTLLRRAARMDHLPSALRLSGIVLRQRHGWLTKARTLLAIPCLLVRFAWISSKATSDVRVLW